MTVSQNAESSALRTHWEIRAFSVPKNGSSEGENEDAVACNPLHQWMAIADGATEASYSRQWARVLADGFAVSRLMGEFPPPHDQLTRVLGMLQSRWHALVPWERLEQRGWLFLHKAELGAFATFMGVKFSGPSWQALGVGDCNLFAVTADGCVRFSGPAQSPEEFGNTPALIPSVPGPGVTKVLESVWTHSSTALRGESIVCSTDAVAAYLLASLTRKTAQGPRHRHRRRQRQLPNSAALAALLQVRTLEEFSTWVDGARVSGMRNDDSTVTIARLCNLKTRADTEGGDGLA